MDNTQSIRETFKTHMTTLQFVLLNIGTGAFYLYYWAVNSAETINSQRNGKVVNKTLPLIAAGLMFWSIMFELFAYQAFLANPFDGGGDGLFIISGLMTLAMCVIAIVFAFSMAKELKSLDNRLHFAGVWLVIFNIYYVYYRLHNFDAQAAAGAAPAQQQPSAAEQLEKLAGLVERGLLTKEEFDHKKQQLLGTDVSGKQDA